MPMRRHANEQEMHFQSLDQEDPLKEEMATYSNILFFFFFCSQISIFIYLFFFTLQYCIGFAIHQQIRHGCNVFPILNPPPTSLRIPSLWGIPVHQPQASCILYFCLENCMDRGARWCTVRVVTESQRRLSD